MSAGDDTELARAYADLAKAEQQAALLEAQLTLLEGKLDTFLADHGEHESRSLDTQQPANDGTSVHVAPRATTSSESPTRRGEGTNP